MADIHVIKVVAETNEDLEKELNQVKGTIIQCVNTLPGNRHNKEYEIIYKKE